MASVTAFMLARGEGAWLAAAALVLGLTLLLSRQSQRAQDEGLGEAEGFELLASSAIAVEDARAQPGNILVAVRHPHALEHVAAALQGGADREVVVMTVRLHGVDTDSAGPDDPTPLPAERYLFARVIALVERYGRPVRLLVVPAATVADGLATAVVRLRSSAVYVGESATLSSADQARLLGEAWERIPKPEPLDVRLVVHHRSGRADTYYLGAHLPALTPGDLDLIHRVWREATRVIGPHVHHHDVVRAALTHMEEQLNGPDRDEALARIRDTARPAEELAAVIRARDFTRLRDMVRNRASSEVAEVLTALGLEDQVVAFRVLPRKDAAAVFEYLSHESQEALLKAMAQEDVAALLNDMAPDDRTMFLEELPAAATRQLLTLLTPEERAVAVNLLGYPEGSIGRLMTPHYVAVREQWTVREVLDYVRRHGRDSETLNMLYVVDDHDALIDDIRIREFLLTDPDRRVAELMDRRYVALKATDDQATAVASFRQHDRVALPVTDTAGMLIGIVTIDDVLDVAEAAATREIQRIGGSEALDEPYMKIAFVRMIQKRAGWLTALFLGEMLTATAMAFFESEIRQAVVLALFIPLIISSGGNAGSQASTLVIRALALGEVGLADWWRVMRREVFAGLALGGILGAIGFLRITILSGFSDIYTAHWLLVAVTVAITLLGIVLWGTVIGSLLPFLLRRLGFDPATSSAPFVATLVDVTGLVIYFSVATGDPARVAALRAPCLRLGAAPWAAAACLLWPIAAHAQQPFVVDDAEVTAPRIWHVELSTQVDLLRSTARPALWQTTTDVELDVGVAPRVELAVLVPLIGLVSETPDGRRLAAGIGDTSFGAKMRFTKSPDARHAFAGSVSIEVPSGDRQRELGSGLVDYGVNLISQHRLDSRWTARLNGGLVLAGNTQTGAVGIKERGTVIIGGGSLVAQATQRVHLGGEMTIGWSEKASLGGSYVSAQLGGNVVLQEGCTLDLALSTGWFDVSPRVGVQAGLSIDLNGR